MSLILTEHIMLKGYHMCNLDDTYGDWAYYDSESEGREYKKPEKFNSYIEDVLSGKNNICKRESPLSE